MVRENYRLALGYQITCVYVNKDTHKLAQSTNCTYTSSHISIYSLIHSTSTLPHPHITHSTSITHTQSVSTYSTPIYPPSQPPPTPTYLPTCYSTPTYLTTPPHAHLPNLPNYTPPTQPTHPTYLPTYQLTHQ